MDKVVKYLLCFLVGFFLAQMFGDGFSVGGNLTPLSQQECSLVYITDIYNPQCVVFSPDGNTLAASDAGAAARTIKLFNVADGTLLNTLKGHTDIVMNLAWHADGTLASCSRDETIKLWKIGDGGQGTVLRTLSGHTNTVASVAFSPDGNTLASGSYDNTVILWKVADGTLLNTLKGHTDVVSCVVFGPYDEMIIASGSFDKTVKYWNVADGKMLVNIPGHTDIVTSIAYGKNGDLDCIISSSPDNTIAIRDGLGGLLESIKDQNTTGWGLSMSPESGDYLVSAAKIDAGKDSSQLIKLMGPGPQGYAGYVIKTYSGSGSHINDIAWSADGKTIACADTTNIFIVKAGKYKYNNVDNENIMGSPRDF